MLDVVRLSTPSESDALLGPPRPRLLATDRPHPDRPARIRSPDAVHSARSDLQVAGRRRSGGLPGLTVDGSVQAESRPQLPPLQAPAVADAVLLGSRARALYRRRPRAGVTIRAGLPERAAAARDGDPEPHGARRRAQRARDRVSASSASWRCSKNCAPASSSRRRTWWSLSSRRDWAGRPLDLAALGLPAGEQKPSRRRCSRRGTPGVSVSQFSGRSQRAGDRHACGAAARSRRPAPRSPGADSARPRLCASPNR